MFAFMTAGGFRFDEVAIFVTAFRIDELLVAVAVHVSLWSGSSV